MEPATIEFGWNAAFGGSLLSIILINVVLSGDNAVVIAMAVQTLPPEKRKIGILAGAGAAAGLRIFFTLIATRLLQTPYLKLAGGALILWIAMKLLSENSDPDLKHRQAHSPMHAIWIIVVADLTMSLDNVLAVAGASKGNDSLLWIGLGLSIPLVIFASGILSSLMDRFPIIVTLGAVLLGKVAGEMIAGDPALVAQTAGIPHFHIGSQIAGAAMILFAAAWMKRKKADANPALPAGD